MIVSNGEAILLLVVLALTVIPLALYTVVTMTKDANDTIHRCDQIREWADERLKELEVDIEELEQQEDVK